MREIIDKITEKAYSYVDALLEDVPEYKDAAISSFEDFLHGAFVMYNMTHDDKLDLEELIYIIESYESH